MRVLWTIVILLLGPIAGFFGGRKLRQVPPRKLIYVSNAINLVVLAAITAAIDLTHGRKAFSLLVSVGALRPLAMWSAATAALCIAIAAVTLSVRMVLRRSPKPSVIALLPRNASEKLAFILLCVLIAAVEEFMYRGFALSALREWLRSGTLAAALVSLSFAFMHGLQDWVAIVAAFVQGVVLTVPVFLVHSLVPSIAGHFVVDVCAGLLLLKALQRLRLVPDET